ncbi:MAG: ATP-binding protein [Pseudomonadota bacterium]
MSRNHQSNVNDKRLSAIPEEEVIAQQVFAITRLTPTMMAANIVNSLALILVLILAGELDASALVWFAVVFTLAAASLIKHVRLRNKTFPSRLSRRSRERLIFHSALLGAIWAFPGILILPMATATTQAFLIAVAAGMTAGGAITLYPIPRAALLFSGIIVVGYTIGFSFVGDPSLIAFAMVSVAFFICIYQSIVRHEEIFVSEFRTRRELAEKNAVIEDLLKETRLKASRKEREAEAKLAQAQKMEAIGTLTAGVAHDFNNLLAVIMGNIELAQIDPDNRESEEYLTSAHSAAHRGAELTQRLLSFGRKATLVAEVQDINTVLDGMMPLLRRTTPASISIDLQCSDEPTYAKIDKGQFESAVLNLVINARDAMSHGGHLTIQSSHCVRTTISTHDGEDIRPGSYVQVMVKDTGVGIPPEMMKRVFEPFFTTKGIGQGSGLGLAMVYGFLKQSGGVSEIESEVGGGTTVTLYFPAAQEEPAQIGYEDPRQEIERIRAYSALVVEDDPAVMKLVQKQLSLLGLSVKVASSGDEAFRMLNTGFKFDLVVTDFSMPGHLQGSSLARCILSDFPETKVILVSGYPANAYEELQSLPAKVPCLTKPVDLALLNTTIKDVLDTLREEGKMRDPTA